MSLHDRYNKIALFAGKYNFRFQITPVTLLQWRFAQIPSLLSLLEDVFFLTHFDGKLAPGGDLARQEDWRERSLADELAKYVVIRRLLPPLHRGTLAHWNHDAIAIQPKTSLNGAKTCIAGLLSFHIPSPISLFPCIFGNFTLTLSGCWIGLCRMTHDVTSQFSRYESESEVWTKPHSLFGA